MEIKAYMWVTSQVGISELRDGDTHTDTYLMNEKVALKRIGSYKVPTYFEEASGIESLHLECLKNCWFRYNKVISNSLCWLLSNVKSRDTPIWLPCTAHCHHSKWFFWQDWTVVYPIPFFNSWLAVTLSFFMWLHLVIKIIYREMYGFCMWNGKELACLILLSAEKFRKICQKCWKVKWTKDHLHKASIYIWLQFRGDPHL